MRKEQEWLELVTESSRELPSIFTFRAVAEELNVGKDAVCTMLIEKMNWQKVCSRFVPHFLTGKQKQVRLAYTRDLVETADSDPNFLKSIVTGDESWCYMYDLQMK